jgi:hypothetical protein
MLSLVLLLPLCSTYAILNRVVSQPQTTALSSGFKHDLPSNHVTMFDVVKEEATGNASICSS